MLNRPKETDQGRLPPSVKDTPQTVGLQTVGLQTVGLQTVGPQTVGPQTVGLQTVGPQTVGLQTVGLQTIDAFDPRVGAQPAGRALYLLQPSVDSNDSLLPWYSW